MNIFGDISGYYKTFMALLKKMPDEEPIGLGDLNDRGPDTKSVFDFFMKNGKTILGNHEHMMLDYLHGEKYYESGLWFDTWGKHTLKSFTRENINFNILDLDVYRQWLESLPLYLEYDDIILTHAPLHPDIQLKEALIIGEDYLSEECDFSILWNRIPPRVRRNKFMAFGHNTHNDFIWYKDEEGPFSICLDTSGYGQLTAMHWPSREIFQQKIID